MITIRLYLGVTLAAQLTHATRRRGTLLMPYDRTSADTRVYIALDKDRDHAEA